VAHSTRRPEHDVGADGDLDIVDALAVLSFEVQGALASRATAHELSMIQVRLLGVLRDREPTMRELAQLLELDKSSVTGLVDRAHGRGFVRRMPSPDDRRSSRVKLTPAGRRVIGEVGNGFRDDIAAAASELSDVERHHLAVLATRVARARLGLRRANLPLQPRRLGTSPT
jgi:DNA-binding MarR family transcriptional regulator